MRQSNLIFSFIAVLVLIISICTQSLYAEGLTLWDVKFVNSSEGWAVGDSGLVIHTTDGGETWEQQYSGTPYNLWAVCFVDPLNGWAVGQSARIYHTTDGGNQWVRQYSGDALGLHDVQFINVNEGWAVGQGGVIIHTTDAGNTWTPQISGTTLYTFYSVSFIDNQYGWVAGQNKAIYRTPNGGQTWESLEPNPSPGVTYWGIHFTDENKGWRTSGVISYTTDGGVSWAIGANHSGYGIQLLNENIGYVVGWSTTVVKTTDGINWSVVSQVGYGNRLHAVSFTDEMTGWAVGQYGLILHTTDGGINWDRQVSGRVDSRVFHNNDTTWFFISDLQLVTDMIEVVIPEKVLQTYTLVEVEISIDTLLHPWVSDLEFYLTHNGVTDTIIFQSSCNGENFFRTTLSDMGDSPISSGTAPYEGIYSPDQPLSRFAGMDPNGEWTLSVYDGEVGNTGQFKGWGLTLYFETPVSIEQETFEFIRDFQLQQNYPNPFNPNTTIRWQQPETGFVTLKVYDVLGREVTTLTNDELSAGKHEVEFDAYRFSSGIYFYQLKAGKFIETKKMLLLK